jgi:biopolymer transport protein ExbD
LPSSTPIEKRRDAFQHFHQDAMADRLTDDLIDLDELARRLDKNRDDPEMDMTPMVDVTFLLLIFFMITAAFALQKSLEVPPVDEESAASQTVEDLEKDSIVVRVDGDNVFWIGSPMWTEEQRAPSVVDMRSKVREARKGGGSGPGPAKMLVQANGDATHEHVVAALDAGSAVGMEDIRLMSYEDGDL